MCIQWSCDQGHVMYCVYSDHKFGLFPSPTVWNYVLLYIIVLCTLYLEEYTVYKLHCNSTWLYSIVKGNFITLDFTIQTFPPLHRYYNRYMYMYMSLVQYMYTYIVYVYITCTVHAYVQYVAIVLVACNI